MKYIFHIADAPPHGREYAAGHRDGFPDGCPCNITIADIASGLKKQKISYKLLKIGTYPNVMARIF